MLALLATGTTQGCTYTVRLLSVPEGATAWLPSGEEVQLPATVTFVRKPRQLVKIEADGYRPLVVDMNRTEGPVLRYIGGALFQKGGREVTYVLIPDEAPAGAAGSAP